MTTTDRIVICAVDLGPLTSRVLYHAAAFARVLGARLKVVHVAESATSMDATAALSRAYARAIPYGAGDEEPDLAIRTGSVGERILEEANRPGVEMLVTGTRALGPLAELVLGSISQGMLRGARVPVLLVPPSDLDIAVLGSARAALTCGPVLAAVDLAEFNSRQLHMASVLAGLAGEGLLFLTVAEHGLDDRAIGAHLRDRAHGLAGVRPTALIVRRGDVVEQIAECVRAERSGLVVMGLRERARGRPGQVAAGVLRTGPAFVLAVPDVAVASNERGRATRGRSFASWTIFNGGHRGSLARLYERDLVRRLRAEFDELPGMHLTFEQATRLTGTDAITSAHALRRLTATGFLERRGVVYRRTDQVLEVESSAATSSAPKGREHQVQGRAARRHSGPHGRPSQDQSPPRRCALSISPSSRLLILPCVQSLGS